MQSNKKKQETAHALLSPSSAHRWLNCTPSARLEETYPNTTSKFAQEGTDAHTLCEVLINNTLGRCSNEYKRLIYSKSPLDMQRYAEEYHDYIINIYKEEKEKDDTTEIYVEQYIDLKEYIPQSFGTADCVIISRDTLHIIDFKYGQGIKVDARENDQLKIYALGIIDCYAFLYGRFKNVVLHIYQPRINNIQAVMYSYDEIMQYGESIKGKASDAFNGLGSEKIGDWCKFCKHKNNCALRFNTFSSIIKEFIKKGEQ